MARIIAVASGKGGVGKTTLVSNLSAALTKFNQSVIAVDSNLTTSNLSLHLGIPFYPKTIQDVLNGDAELKEALYYHPSGFYVLPADFSLTKLRKVKPNDFMGIFYNLVGRADFILIDCAAGLGREALAAIEASDEMIVCTNPELTAVMDALKLIKITQKLGTDCIGVVVNRIRKEKGELSLEYIKSFLNLPILGHIPEDPEIRTAIANKETIITYNPRAKSSYYIKSIASKLLGKEVKESFATKLFGWLRY